MKLYQTGRGPVVERAGVYHAAGQSWDALIAANDLPAVLAEAVSASPGSDGLQGEVLAPIGSQEVWAAGVTYFRSRTARMEESKSAGGGDFYDRVYAAQRPELFFKASASRVVGNGAKVRIRRDSKWNVPEPELTLLINPRGKIIGYTIGNDMSSRDIEGENPLYLPQAKMYDGSCALGPAVLVTGEPLEPSTEIAIEIRRGGDVAFSGSTTLAQLKRDPAELVEYLYRETSFPTGCYLLTGTGVVPPDAFTLTAGDEIAIRIEPIGTLTNVVA
ncbi:MAG: 2-hydroxyhepta-2,4-diene,7-dioate isomerase [Phycisphaerales bacterium]|nr:2-hydroxyhepta-2,4-diene,7-dioate isomerase [Phycisphaerales bacterium]